MGEVDTMSLVLPWLTVGSRIALGRYAHEVDVAFCPRLCDNTPCL
jgi:hypothetical protein